MRVSRYLSVVFCFLVPGGCSEEGASSDAGVSDSGLPSDGRLKDSSMLPDSTTPGCGTRCPAESVCFEGTCTDVGPTKTCESGTFPANLPEDNDGIFYVNAASGAGGDGSEAKPFKTISAALAAIPEEKKYTVAVAAGDYDESLLIGSRTAAGGEQTTFGVDIYCTCPEKVFIRQKVRVSPMFGQPSPLKVIIDGCSVIPREHDACRWATCDEAPNAPAGIDVRGGTDSVHVLLRDSVVSGWCTGLYYSAEPGSLLDASLCVARSRVSGNHTGIDVTKAPLNTVSSESFRFPECSTLDENLGVVLSRFDHNRDYAVFTRRNARGIAMKGNLVEGSGELCGVIVGQGFGIYLGDTDSAQLTANLIQHNENRGIALRNDVAKVSSGINVVDNVLLGNAGAGIALQKMQATVEIELTGNQIFDTRARAGEKGGDGIQVSVDEGSAYKVNIANNTVGGSARHGLFYDGVDGSVEGNTVTTSSEYGCVLQRSAASIGTNNWDGNVSGDVHNYTDPVVLYGDLPIPIQ